MIKLTVLHGHPTDPAAFEKPLVFCTSGFRRKRTGGVQALVGLVE